MPVYQTTGGLFDQATPTPPNTAIVGAVALTFVTCDSAVFTENLDDINVFMELVRVGPSPPGCSSPHPPDARGTAQFLAMFSWSLYTAGPQTLLKTYSFDFDSASRGVNGWYVKGSIGNQAGYDVSSQTFSIIDLPAEDGFVWSSGSTR